MTRRRLVEVLCDLENQAVRWSTKSYECGAHDNEDTKKEMKKADADFSNTIIKLRNIIISEGVTE